MTSSLSHEVGSYIIPMPVLNELTITV